MYILVCGGRDFYDYSIVSTIMQETKNKFGRFIVIQGGARGADSVAQRWCLQNGVGCITVKADWNKNGRAAGSIRNQRMIDEYDIEYGIAFPGGRGTVDMISRLENNNIPVRRVVV